MLVCWDLGFTRWDSLYLKNIRKCCLCKVPLFSPWLHEPWLLGIQPVFWRKTLAPGGEVHHTGMETGARNFAFFHVKWLRPAMKGTSCARRVRLGSFWFLLYVLKWEVFPVCVVLCVSWICGCRSHWNGCRIVVIWCCRVGSEMQVSHVMLQNAL